MNGQPNMNSQIAVFIDFENIATAAEREHQELDISLLIDFLKTRGRIAIKRAYGDWGRYPKYKLDLLENAIDLIHLYSYGVSGKNRADIRLAIDAIEAVFSHENVEVFTIMSGDSDFSSLITKLREYGKYTIGIGLRKSTSDLLVKSCDEFIFYETLLGSPDLAREFDRSEAQDLLIRALKAFEQKGEIPINASKLKQTMVALDPSFNEANYGYEQFQDFLEDSRSLVKLEAVGKTLLVSPLASGEMEDLPSDDELPLALRYERFLKKVGFGVISVQSRRGIIEDFYALMRTVQREMTLNLAIDLLKERYDTEGILYSKFTVREVMKLTLRSGCLSFTGGPPSFATPVVLPPGVSLDDLIRRSEMVYLSKIVEGHLPVVLEDLSIALFQTASYADYIEDLLGHLVQAGIIERDQAGFRPRLQELMNWISPETLAAVSEDLAHVTLPPDLRPTSAEARRVFDEGSKSRKDFAVSSIKYLQAAKLQQLALESGEPEAVVDDFKWYLASYCSVQAGFLYFQKNYDAAIPYYLAFFSLVYEGEILWDRVKGLINPMLSYYFVIAANRLGAPFPKRPGYTDPAEVAVLLYNHPHAQVRAGFEEQIRLLAGVNLALVRNLLSSIRSVQADPLSKDQTAAYLRQIALAGASDLLAESLLPTGSILDDTPAAHI